MKRLVFIGLLICGTFFYGGCSLQDEVQVTVTMINHSSLETHMWTNGESINANNKLAPNQSREKTISIFIETDKQSGRISTDDTIVIAAGRNGVQLTQVGTGLVDLTGVPCTLTGVFLSTEVISTFNDCQK